MARYKKIRTNATVFSSEKLDTDTNVFVGKIKVFLDFNSQVLRPHQTDFYALRFILDGEGELLIDHVSYLIQKNWINFVSPDKISVVSIPKETTFEYLLIAFTPSFIDRMGFTENIKSFITGPARKLNFLVDEDGSKSFKKYFELIHYEYSQQKNEEILAALIRALLIRIYSQSKELIGQKAPNRSYDNIFRDFLSSLNLHFRSSHFVADYVEMLQVSEKQLNRACHSIANKPANKIISEKLDFEAKRLLFHSSNSVKEIGFHLGFKDPAHFVKFFKKQNGMTPNHFRQNN